MNDTLIIVICIFLMSIIWNFYFKNLKEGINNTDNYVMPISFSNNNSTNPSKDESKTINVPGQITSNNDLTLMKNTNIERDLNVKGTTNLNREIKIPMDVPIHFGVGQNKQVDAGKISYGTWDGPDILSIVGGGQIPRKVKIWDNLSVASDLNVGGNTTTNSLNVGGNTVTNSLTADKTTTNNLTVGNTTTNSLNIGNTEGVLGIQAGIAEVTGHNYRVTFPKEFAGDEVIVVTNPSGSTIGWEWNFMTNVISANKSGFNVTITGISGGGTWLPQNVSITWIAFCKGFNKNNIVNNVPPPAQRPEPQSMPNQIVNTWKGITNVATNFATDSGNKIANVATASGNKIANVATDSGNKIANVIKSIPPPPKIKIPPLPKIKIPPPPKIKMPPPPNFKFW